jgi:hypothetical protein
MSPIVIARSEATKQSHVTHRHCEEQSDEAISGSSVTEIASLRSQ